MKSHPSSTSTEKLSLPAACPICRTSELKRCFPGRDRLFSLAPGSFDLVQCRSCSCIFQHPLPEIAALEKFYPDEYWWSERDPQASGCVRLIRKLEKRYRDFVIQGHARFLEECARRHSAGGKLLLDVGCGNGTFLNAARLRGFQPHGMDVSARAVEIAGTQYGLHVRQGGIGSHVWDGCRFDFITMFHVLEHLPDPRFALDFVRGLLRPAGVLILQVPNISSIQARIFGRRWYGLDVPRHVVNFSPKALSLLLKEMGFEFQLVPRFSLRDNPASIASSMVPSLDPVGRKGRGLDVNPVASGAMEIAYLGLFLLAVPAAFVESSLGMGGTIWACARSK